MVFKLLFTLMLLGGSAVPAMSATLAHEEPCPPVTPASLLLSHDCESETDSEEAVDTEGQQGPILWEPNSSPERLQPSPTVQRKLVAHNLDRPEIAIHYFAPNACPEKTSNIYNADRIPTDQVYVLLCDESGVDYLMVLVGPRTKDSNLRVWEIRKVVHDTTVQFVEAFAQNEQEALDNALLEVISATTEKADSNQFWERCQMTFIIVIFTSIVWVPMLGIVVLFIETLVMYGRR